MFFCCSDHFRPLGWVTPWSCKMIFSQIFHVIPSYLLCPDVFTHLLDTTKPNDFPCLTICLEWSLTTSMERTTDRLPINSNRKSNFWWASIRVVKAASMLYWNTHFCPFMLADQKPQQVAGIQSQQSTNCHPRHTERFPFTCWKKMMMNFNSCWFPCSVCCGAEWWQIQDFCPWWLRPVFGPEVLNVKFYHNE